MAWDTISELTQNLILLATPFAIAGLLVENPDIYIPLFCTSLIFSGPGVLTLAYIAYIKKHEP